MPCTCFWLTGVLSVEVHEDMREAANNLVKHFHKPEQEVCECNFTHIPVFSFTQYQPWALNEEFPHLIHFLIPPLSCHTYRKCRYATQTQYKTTELYRGNHVEQFRISIYLITWQSPQHWNKIHHTHQSCGSFNMRKSVQICFASQSCNTFQNLNVMELQNWHADWTLQ